MASLVGEPVESADNVAERDVSRSLGNIVFPGVAKCRNQDPTELGLSITLEPKQRPFVRNSIWRCSYSLA